MSARNRTTVVETVYHQGGVAEPTTLVTRCSKPSGAGQLYSRVLFANQEWTQLDSGWVEKPGTLHVKNDDKKRTLLIAIPGKEYMLTFAKVSPGHSLRLEPIDVRQFFVRCDDGLVQFTVTVMPE